MLASGIIMSASAQGAFKLILAVTAIVVARLTLVWFDRSIDDDGKAFSASLTEASPNARMGYFAARFVGVCIVVGLAIS